MSSSELDPIKYEVFVRRLITLLEEARTAIAMVSGSPAIVEGGECMASIYDGEGRGILTAAGTLFHVLGAGDSIGFTIREYEDNPGIHDGDQLLYFDPYIAGTHLMDHITIKPVFYEGKRVAWVGMMTHTSDIGGVLRGISSEIFHEGIRLRGIKLAEGGKVRKDTLEIITQQCRDPDYVKIDLLATLAANNVSSDGLVRMIEKFGLEFVEAAGRKLREDTAKLAKERIRSLPDGVWRERVYVSRTKEVEGEEVVVPLKIECSATKEGDRLFFDIDASPQTEDYANATFPASRSSLFGSLAGFLFPDILWNAGMIDLVEVKITDESFANCKFPASCGLGTMVGLTLMGAASGCIARMMYAGGYYDFVNSSWGQLGLSAGSFGPGVWYGGHNQYGGIVGQGTYDLFAGGGGATPFRDGNDTGGIYCNPTSCISDVEFTEIYWPFLFLSRYLAKDSGGYGKFRGGRNLEMIETIYGTRDLSVDYLPGPPGGEVRGFGLFGGYPTGNILGDSKLVLTSEDFLQGISDGYPVIHEEIEPTWGVSAEKSSGFSLRRHLGGIRVNVPEFSLLCYSEGPGGGYGDPLDRDSAMVARDIEDEAVTIEIAEKVYGVVVDPETLKVDFQKTEKRRQEIRQERLDKGQSLSQRKNTTKLKPSDKRKSLIKIHEYLEIVEKADGTMVICCMKCNHEFCQAGENYKTGALRWTRDIRELKKIGEGVEPLEYYQEYICPECGTLLQVDTWCPQIDSDEPLWDINVKV